jgi:hypothetical protein
MITSIIPFDNDPLGCYNYIDQKKYFTKITTDNTPVTIDLLGFSSTGDSLISATLSASCTSIGSSPNIAAYYTGHIVISITNGVASIVCSNINEICSESAGIDLSVDINTSSAPPVVTCDLVGENSYTIYWVVECSFKIIDGILDPYCPEPNSYISGTDSPEDNNDPGPSPGPPSVTAPVAPAPQNDTPVFNPPELEIFDNTDEI